jgi:hypothetical protein
MIIVVPGTARRQNTYGLSIALQRRLKKGLGDQTEFQLHGLITGGWNSGGMGLNSNSATDGPLLARDHAMTAGKNLVASCATRSALHAEE